MKVRFTRSSKLSPPHIQNICRKSRGGLRGPILVALASHNIFVKMIHFWRPIPALWPYEVSFTCLWVDFPDIDLFTSNFGFPSQILAVWAKLFYWFDWQIAPMIERNFIAVLLPCVLWLEHLQIRKMCEELRRESKISMAQNAKISFCRSFFRSGSLQRTGKARRTQSGVLDRLWTDTSTLRHESIPTHTTSANKSLRQSWCMSTLSGDKPQDAPRSYSL